MILALELPEEAYDNAIDGEGLECHVLWRRNARQRPVIYHESRGSFGVKGITYLDATHPVQSMLMPTPLGESGDEAMIGYLRWSGQTNGFRFGRWKGELPAADGVQSDRFGVFRG